MNRHRGYSLVEVLIATTVLGLGLLGLIAILAGSAAQQQTASMQNLSVGVARNAEGVLSRLLGRPGDLTTVREGQWTFVPMDDQTQYLTVFPGFLLVPFSNTTTLFDRGVNVGATFTAPLDSGSNYSGSSYGPGVISRLRHRRIDLESGFKVTVNTLRLNAVGIVVTGSTFSFVEPTIVPIGGDQVGLVESQGAQPNLIFDRRIEFPSGKAEISSFNLSLNMGEFVNEITVEPYFWRNDQLISLTDRLVTEPQADYPGGERPIMTYSALIRRKSASTQLCFFLYSCRALSKPREVDTGQFRGLALVPPDTAQEVEFDEGVLREVEVELGYERETQRYFFEIDASDAEVALKGWAMTQGQILMMSSRLGVIGVSENPGDPGADFPVRIVSTRTDTENRTIQAFLDRSPRVGGRTPLMDLNNPGARQPVFVWGIQPVIRSRTDGTEWALTPIAARVIQVADQ